ncbi:MAG: hypothetical protein E7254_00170 [Lachnospiraceae bacterium]|nr:hypothetical protein [Lachnospiraceae bacterium]
MKNKIISLFLSLSLICGAFYFSPYTNSYADVKAQSLPNIDDYINPDELQTKTYLFYMPDEWFTEYNATYDGEDLKTGSACIYWWSVSPYPNSWPGYLLTKRVDGNPNIFSATVPSSASPIIWNDTIDTGHRPNEDAIAHQTINISASYYYPKESSFYPEGIESFDGMIYVFDCDNANVDNYMKTAFYSGDWFYYYGNGEYGYYKTREEAAAHNAVYSNGLYPGYPLPEPETTTEEITTIEETTIEETTIEETTIEETTIEETTVEETTVEETTIEETTQDITTAKETTPETIAQKPTSIPESQVSIEEPSIKSFQKGASQNQVNRFVESIKSEKDPKGSIYNILCAKQKKVKKNSITISWNKIKGATSYNVYGAKCGKTKGKFNTYKKLATIKGTRFTDNNLSKGSYYKYIVVAFDKNNKAITSSKTLHITTKGGKKGNAKSVRLSKNKIKLSPKKTFKISAKEISDSSKLSIAAHRKISYESSNKKVVTVSKKGIVKGRKKGTAYIYVYAQNGIYKKIKVTVK